MGIYSIIHNQTEKAYIGQSKNLPERWKQHQTMLRNNTHHNKGMQEDYNKDQTNPFIFKIIYLIKNPYKYSSEELQDILDILEWKFVNEYNKDTETYNIAKIHKPEATRIPQEIIDNLFDGEVWVLPEYRPKSRKKETHYNTYVKLLEKYKIRHPLEKWSTESYTRETKERRRKKYIQESKYLMDKMKLKGNQKQQLTYMIINYFLHN